MKKEVIGILSLFVIITLSSLVLASSVQDNIPVQIQTTDSSGNIVTGTFTFQINITNSSDCTNILYSNTTTQATDARGIVSYLLPNVTLPFDQQYYFCYYRNGVLQSTITAARTPYAFTAKNISASGINNDSNINILNYNITASYLFGNGQFLTGIPGGSNPSFTNVNISNLLTLNPQTSPTGASSGSLFFNSSLNAPMFYNGTNWIGLTGGIGSSIVSSGNNSNGYWIQYADGTMVEWGNVNTTVTTSSGGTAVFFAPASQVVNFPIPFANTPTVSTSVYGVNTSVIWSGISGAGTNTTSFSAIPISVLSNGAGNLSWIAMGRWTNLNLGTGSGGIGGIVNTITNANGTCTEWANGIAECQGIASYNSISVNNSVPATNLYYSNQMSLGFPITFASPPITTIKLSGLTSGLDASDASNASTTQGFFRVWGSCTGGCSGAQAITFAANYVAIGRWTNSTNINTPDVSTWGLSSTGNVVLVNSSRFVGINNTNPTSPLSFATMIGDKIDFYKDVGGGDYKASIFINELRFSTNQSADFISLYPNNTLTLVAKNGNVGIGTTTPQAALDLGGGGMVTTSTIPFQLGNFSSTYNKTVIYANDGTNTFDIDLARLSDSIGATPLNFMITARGGTTFLKINGSTGNVGIGMTPGHLLDVNTNDVALASSTVWISRASDSRLKTKISNFTDGLNIIDQINPINFKFNGITPEGNDTSNHIGLFADQLSQIAPYMAVPRNYTITQDDMSIINSIGIDNINKNTPYPLPKDIKSGDNVTLYGWDANALNFIFINSFKELQSQNQNMNDTLAQQNQTIQQLQKELCAKDNTYSWCK